MAFAEYVIGLYTPERNYAMSIGLLQKSACWLFVPETMIIRGDAMKPRGL